MMLSYTLRARRPAPGFSLVEIMVATVISLIGMIVVFQVFSVFEGRKRTATSGGDAQQNGSLALYAIEREVRMGGYGINYAPLLGCNVLAYDAGPPARNFTFTMSGAQITDGLGTSADSITVVYGNSPALMGSVQILAAATATSNNYAVSNGFGFTSGDILIAGEVGKSCSMSQLTAIAAGVATHDVGSYTDANGVTQTARYNKPGGLGVDYIPWDQVTNTGGRLFDLGRGPTVVTYAINASSQLTATYPLRSTVAAAVADGIVQLQAQYGLDNDGDGVVEAWAAASPVNAAGWASVLALRLVVVARSGHPERPDPATGVCTTTTVAPTSMLGAIDLTADPNWQCYRYRLFETVVPLRNQIWAPL